MSSETKYKALKVVELKELLQKAGLPTTGKKEELIERLTQYDAANANNSASATNNQQSGDEFAHLAPPNDFNIDDLAPPKIESLMDSSKVQASANPTNSNPPLAAPQSQPHNETKPPPAEEPKVVQKEGSNFKYVPISFSGPQAASKVDSEEEKRRQRAARFGIPLSEEERRKERATKFGMKGGKEEAPAKTATPVENPKTSLDPETLKKRQERFGIVNKAPEFLSKQQSAPSQPPQKKPPSAAQPQTKSTAPIDPEEEEKRRKRAERFGLSENGNAAKKAKSGE
ncbi:uncharacterized protein VTP21DRAFT_2509 [Calcarisporiella thermophila]|uniref:uncharacterized protein n=1 Tax=Calcarisporiella thermophila TaxID=911321 RepID=UPI0037427F6B